MRKRKAPLALLAVCALVVLTSSGAFASTFENRVDFTSPTSNGRNTNPYLEITGTYSYFHSLTGLNDPFTLDSASLSLQHNGNSNNDGGELWFSSYNNSLEIGKLSTSRGDTWATNTWTLSAAIISAINSGATPWVLYISLNDTTSGTDKIKISQSIVRGSYTSTPAPVPLPGSVLLFGSGLLGLIGIRSRRNHNS